MGRDKIVLKVNHEKLQVLMKSNFLKIGLCLESAEFAVNSMIETSLRGVDSHGINLYPHYVDAIKYGRINKSPKFNFYKDENSISCLNADDAIGHHAGIFAVDKAIENAEKFGVGIVSVKNSSHFGAASFFSLYASRKNFMSFSFTNADALVKAFNSKESFFGTNPICFTVPMINEDPFCLDMATSCISWNKVKNFRYNDMRLNENVAFDKNGDFTLNPHLAHSLNSIGDYKGFGLGFMIEILCSLLTGSVIGKDMLPMFGTDLSQARKVSHFFMVIDINKFIDIDHFKFQVQNIAERVRGLSSDNTNKQVLIPGDPEKITIQIRKSLGIPIDDSVFRLFKEIDSNFMSCIC